MPAEAGTRSAVPWGVVGLACGTVEPEICVIKVLRFYLAFVGGPSVGVMMMPSRCEAVACICYTSTSAIAARGAAADAILRYLRLLLLRRRLRLRQVLLLLCGLLLILLLQVLRVL